MNRLIAALVCVTALAACSTQEPQDLGQPVGIPGAPSTSTPPLNSSSSVTLADTYEALYSCDAVSSTKPSDLPPITLPCMDGSGNVDATFVKGPLAVTIWASWCVPCKRELPAFVAVNSKLRSAGYPARILGLNWLDDPEQAVAAAQEWGINFPSLHDGDALMRAPLGINAQPATLFIDASGRVVHVERGPIDTEAELLAKLRQFLGVEVTA